MKREFSQARGGVNATNPSQPRQHSFSSIRDSSTRMTRQTSNSVTPPLLSTNLTELSVSGGPGPKTGPFKVSFFGPLDWVRLILALP